MGLPLFRNKSVAMKEEATPGTQETLGVADYYLEATELSGEPGVEMIEKNTFRDTISKSADRVGKKTANMSIAGEFKNSGVLNTKPAIDLLLQIGRYVPAEVISASIGSISGAVARGLTVITGATSSAVGIALAVEDGDLFLYPVSGTFADGEDVDGDNGFSATISTVSASKFGWAYMPGSKMASEKTASILINDGGIQKPAYGCVSNVSFELSTSNYPMFTASIQGILDNTNWGLDANPPSGIALEDHLPGIVNSAGMLIDGAYAPVAQSVNFDMGNNLVVLDDLNRATWLAYGVSTARVGTGSINMIQPDADDFDLYRSWFSGDTASLEFSIGSGAGNVIDIICPAIQYSGVTPSDDRGFQSNGLGFGLTGKDNELVLWFR